MHISNGYDPLTPKETFYNELLEETQAIVEGQKNWVKKKRERFPLLS